MAPTQPFRPRAPKKNPKNEDSHKGSVKHRKDDKRRTSGSSDPIGMIVSHLSDESHSRDGKGRVRERQGYEYNRNSANSDSGSDLDLDKPLYAIGDYLHDRKELVAQMFKSIKNDMLLRMIPPVLREFSLKELQEKCEFELEGFSRKRARAVINGQDMVSSSGTDDSEEDEQIIQNHAEAKDIEISDIAALSEKPSTSMLSIHTPTSSKPEEIILDLSAEQSGLGEQREQKCLTTVEPLEMELVELELRAQAIRALMVQLDEDDSDMSIPGPRCSDSYASQESDCADELLAADLCSMISSDVKKSRSEREYFQIHPDEEELAEFE